MKGSKILGFLVAALAVIVLITGIIGSGLEDSGSSLSVKWAEGTEVYNAVTMHDKALKKTAPSAIKKASTAVSAADDAIEKINAAAADTEALKAAVEAGEATGDEMADELMRAVAAARIESEEGVSDNEEIAAMAEARLAVLYGDYIADAQKALKSAEDKIKTADDGIASVYSGLGMEYDSLYAESEECTTIEACLARAEEMKNTAAALSEAAQTALTDAENVVKADLIDAQTRFLIFTEKNWMGFIFTAVILFAVAAIMIFCPSKFVDNWRNVPVFSTGMAVLVMIAIQTYALGFDFSTIGEWLTYWFNNAMNVLRANSSVGMIALAMTFVIISGGIDLAVGSTLAGISTIIMCLIDVGEAGPLTALGITGLPAYLIACAAGIIAGLLLGALTGVIITKGSVPPFIVTLGMMQLIRSVAQYFTKSYTPEVPKAFQSLANSVIKGQMLLPIVYWLVLAVILYIVSQHTAFGRHVYAVGSNERTTRLSGINIDKVKMKVYILSGFVVSLASILQVSRLRGVDVASAGNGYEMNAIAAVVVGGTSMAGGKGSIIGTVLGVLIIGIMNNLLVLLSVDTFLSNAFTGAIVIAAVLMQRKEKTA